MNKEKILFIVTNPLVTMEMVTSGSKIRDQGSNFRYETCKARLLPSFVTITKVFSLYSPYSLTVKYHFPYSKITNKDTKEKL